MHSLRLYWPIAGNSVEIDNLLTANDGIFRLIESVFFVFCFSNKGCIINKVYRINR